jgi:hypothetical protein
MYLMAERNCERADGVKRIFTGLIFGKHSIRFSQNRREVITFPGGNLLIATG